MSRAKFRKVYGKNGSGRFVVSEGIAPSVYLTANPALPTLWFDSEDDRFEIVIPKGTILSVIADSLGNSTLVPANGTSGTKAYNDGGTATPPEFVTVPAQSKPIGAAQANILRPFDKGTSIAGSWITRAFVEWPVIAGLNSDLVPGDLVRADILGRAVKCSNAEAAATPWVVVGKVIEVSSFATNFDDGLLSYMVLPSDPGALREVYAITTTGPYTGKLGVPANLDITGSVGAVRVTLNV